MVTHSGQFTQSARDAYNAPRWHNCHRLGNAVSRVGCEWLYYQGSLSARLQCQYGNSFALTLIGQSRGLMRPDEARLMGLRSPQAGIVREVALSGGGAVRLYAKTVLPLTSLNGVLGRVVMLGNNSIGNILFTRGTVERARVEFSILRPGQALFETVASKVGERWPLLLGRRTVFVVQSKPVLIYEFFIGLS